MKAFHNDPLLKEKYITRIQDHYNANEIRKGKAFDNGKCDSIGCTIHSGQIKNYEKHLGIPMGIASYQKMIFEFLPDEIGKAFPLLFLSSIPVGADLYKEENLFSIWRLTNSKNGFIKFVKNKKAIEKLVFNLEKDIKIPFSKNDKEELNYELFQVYNNYFFNWYNVFNSEEQKIFMEDWAVDASSKLIELLKEAKKNHE